MTYEFVLINVLFFGWLSASIIGSAAWFYGQDGNAFSVTSLDKE